MTNKKKILGYPVNVQYSDGLIPTGGVTGGGSPVVPAVIKNYNMYSDELLGIEKGSGVTLLSATFDGEGGNGSGTPGVGEGGNGSGTPGVGEGGSGSGAPGGGEGGSGSGTPGVGEGGSGSGAPGGGISGLSEGVIDPVVQGAYKQLYEHYDDIYKRNEEAANAQKNQAYATAEQNYQNAVAEAQAGYYKNLAGYGSKAEQLDRMGLGSSGYSDYLTGKAMELQRSETQAAAVERNAAKSAADQLYSQNLLTAESARDKDKLAVLEKQLAEYKQNKIDRNTVIAGLLDFASSGSADIDTLKALGKEGGIAADDPIWDTVEAKIERAAAAKKEANLQAFKQALFEGQNPFIDNFDPSSTKDVNTFYLLASIFGIDTNSDEFGEIAKRLGIAWTPKNDENNGTDVKISLQTLINMALEGTSYEDIQKYAEENGVNITDAEWITIKNIANLKSDNPGYVPTPTTNIAYDNGNFIQAKYTGVNEQGQHVYEWNGEQIVVNPGVNPYTLTRNADVNNGYFEKTPYQPDNISGQKLSKTGNFAYVSGVKQNIWKTPDGRLWLWNGVDNKYYEYDSNAYPAEMHKASNGVTDEDLKTAQVRGAYFDVDNVTLDPIAKRISAAVEMGALKTTVNSGGYLYTAGNDLHVQKTDANSSHLNTYVRIDENAKNDGDNFDLHIEGKRYDLEIGKSINQISDQAIKDELNNTLNDINKAPQQGSTAVVCGDLYVYAGGEWRTTSADWGVNDNEYKNAVEAYVKRFKNAGTATT